MSYSLFLSFTFHIFLLSILFFINISSNKPIQKRYYIDFIGKTEVINAGQGDEKSFKNTINSNFLNKNKSLKLNSEIINKNDAKKQIKQIDDSDYIYTNSRNIEPSMINEKSEIITNNLSTTSDQRSDSISHSFSTHGRSITFGSDFPYPYYITKLRSVLYDNWQAKEIISSNLKAIVRFNISKDGNITGIKIYSSSGNRIFDETVLSTIYGIGKLDPLPVDFNEAYLTVYVEFKSMD